MNSWTKKIGGGLILTLAVFCLSLVVINQRASGLDQDQVRALIKEASELLIKGGEPSAEQKQKIQDLKKMVDGGEIKKADIKKMVEEQIGSDIEKYEFTRYQIKGILDRTPELFPGVTGDDLHQMLWNKASSMLDEPLELKIGTLAPEGTAWLEFPKNNLNPHLKKISNGKVSIKMYVGGVMGEDVDILRKMDMGQLDGCGCTALGVFKAAPEVSILSLPMLFRDYKEADHIMKTFRKEIDAAFDEKGYLLGGLIDTGFFYLWTKNKVANLEDIKKQKMMTWFGPIETTTFEELGIRPTPISVPEIVTSLNTGLVDASYGPAPWILGTQAYTNLNYYVKPPLFYSPGAIIFSRKIQDRFRGKYSDVLINNFTELLVYESNSMEREWIDDHLRPYEEKCIKAFEKYGIKAVTLSDEDIKTLETVSKRVWDKLAGKIYSRQLLDKVLKELEDFRKQ